jgi:hypothetical protein
MRVFVFIVRVSHFMGVNLAHLRKTVVQSLGHIRVLLFFRRLTQYRVQAVI